MDKKPIQIFQIEDIRNCDYAFRSYEEAKQGGFSPSDYAEVYNGFVGANDSLDDIFMMFNINHPQGFKGHSLSVSDVISVPEGMYYVDDIGFSRISLFDF